MMCAAHNDFKRVRKEGGTRVVAVGKYLPQRWKMVTLKVIAKERDKSVTIKFEKVA